MELLVQICKILFYFTVALNAYTTVYIVLGFICIPLVVNPDPTRYTPTFVIHGKRRRYGLFCMPIKYKPTDKTHTYAFALAARNEEAVIGQLIESIHAQTYDPALLTIFVVADNCTDSTAQLCRELGCVVYERNDPTKARKGYALEYLFNNIAADYGIESFDGYFIFDADNLLDTRFVEEMNKAFAAGETVITAYRNTKNFDTNWVSSAYGIHFYHNSLAKHRPRSLLGLGTHLTGTGYLIASHHLADGWHYTSMTEDDELTLRLTGQGVKIAYCEAAEFFDEQPTSFAVSFRQRIRWAQGRLRNFFHHGLRPLKALFTRGSLTGYDIFVHYFPGALIIFAYTIVMPAVTAITALFGRNDFSLVTGFLWMYGGIWLNSLLTAILTMLRESKQIYCSKPKAFLYTLIYPWFGLISPYITLIALTQKRKWVPIVHQDERRIEDIKPQDIKTPEKDKTTV